MYISPTYIYIYSTGLIILQIKKLQIVMSRRICGYKLQCLGRNKRLIHILGEIKSKIKKKKERKRSVVCYDL